MAKQYATSIYIHSTKKGMPPQATVLAGVVEQDNDRWVLMGEVEKHIATWSRDMGCWCIAGMPIADLDLDNALTEHAKDLGVEW